MTTSQGEKSADKFEEKDAAPKEVEYLEFVGFGPTGAEFYTSHSVTAKQMKDHYDIDLGKNAIVWRKRPDGRMLVPVSDMTPEAAEILANDPMFKHVKL